MDQIIKRYCENENTSGLMLLDMPTGSGKSYQVVRYIANAIQQDPDGKQKFFFITTLKKNLPEQDLRAQFEKAGQLELFNSLYLRVKSNTDSVLEGLAAAEERGIPEFIYSMDEFKNLKHSIADALYFRTQEKTSRASDGIEKRLADDERTFRRMLRKQINKHLRGLSARKKLEVIKTDSDWQWIGELYPVVFMRERRIILMSMDKFLVTTDTLVENAGLLYNTDIIDGAIIFIDEFDATKETVLRTIIQNGLRGKVDYIDLFNQIYTALRVRDFPAALTAPSQARQCGKYADHSLQGELDRIAAMAEEIHTQYFLRYHFKSEQNTDEVRNNFLFQDHRYHSILDGNKRYIGTRTDHRERLNTILFLDEKPDETMGSIPSMLGTIRGFITQFNSVVWLLAQNYKQCRDEDPRYRDEFKMDEAVRTVLSVFNLAQEYITFLKNQMLASSVSIRANAPGASLDLSLYQRGFRYYSIEDAYVHDLLSKLMLTSFSMTPEKLLTHICTKAKVLGISATATLPTVIGNYDIGYLARKLGDRYVTATKEERERLANSFREIEQGYDQISIHTELIDSSGYSVDSWRAVVDDDELAEYMYSKVEQECAKKEEEEKGTYHQQRYLRIAVVFKRFLLNNRIQSFLCVLTKHPRRGDWRLNLDVLHEIFKITAEAHGVPYSEELVAQLDGEEYDTKKDSIIRRLGQGERLFVISVYQTIGAGQNLQYPIPKAYRNQLVYTNTLRHGTEKDFDAIYLDRPTNLLPQLTDNITEEDFVKYLFCTEQLQEQGEVSQQEATTHIKQAFMHFSPQKSTRPYAGSMQDCPSVMQYATRIVIQAVGRICRTNVKSRDIYIYADSGLADKIAPDVSHNRIFNKELLSLVDAIEQQAVQRQLREQEFKNLAELASSRAKDYIDSFLRGRWSNERMLKWAQLREMVLTHPVITEEAQDQYGYINSLYVKLPEPDDKIFYTQEGDYDQVNVFFHQKKKCPEVSAYSSHLTELMELDFLRELFEEKGWATTFPQGSYIMSPPLFNNIYRGALGEVAGKALFRHYANIELKDIEDPDKFEKFDYLVPGTAIYVDFKNWHRSTVKDSEREFSHIAQKARTCDCRCVIVANILGDPGDVIRKQTVDGIRIVVIPALLVKGNPPTPMVTAWDEIRSCYREFAD